MIRYGDVVNFGGSYNKFKPWWEKLFDLYLIGMFLVSMIAWNKSNSEASGMICLPLDGGADSIGIAESRYLISNCQHETYIALIVFYPYVVIVEWFILFALQNSWIIIPAVSSKFNSLTSILDELDKIEYFFIKSDIYHGVLPLINFNQESWNQMKVIHDKLTFILMEKSLISKAYIWKTSILTSVLVFCFLSSGAWLGILEFSSTERLSSDFTCTTTISGDNVRISEVDINNDNLTDKFVILNPADVLSAVCTLASSLHFYGIMIFHIILLIFMLLNSLYSLYWFHTSLREAFKAKDNEGMFGNSKDYYKGLPGCNDLVFCVSLLNSNVKEGQLRFQILKINLTLRENRTAYDYFHNNIEYSSNQYFEKTLINTKHNNNTDTQLILSQNIQNTIKSMNIMNTSTPIDKKKTLLTKINNEFDFHYSAVTIVCKSLGLYQMKNSQKPGHIYTALNQVFSKCFTFHIYDESMIHSFIAKELSNKYEFYKSYLKEVNSDTQTKNNDTINQIIANINIDHFVILKAFSSVFNCRIIAINSSEISGINIPCIYEPETYLIDHRSHELINTFYMSYVMPSYFHACDYYKDSSKDYIINDFKLSYIANQSIRTKLFKLAMRYIDNSTESYENEVHLSENMNPLITKGYNETVFMNPVITNQPQSCSTNEYNEFSMFNDITVSSNDNTIFSPNASQRKNVRRKLRNYM